MEADLQQFRIERPVQDFTPYERIIPRYYNLTEQEVIDALENVENFATRFKDFKHITSFLRWKHTEVPLLDEYRKKLDEINDEIQKAKTSVPLNVNKEDLVKKVNELPETNYQEVQKKLVLKFMADENFVLRGDLISIKYRNYTEKDNKLVLNTIYFAKMNKKGAVNESFVIKPDTLDLITKLLGYPEAQESDFLLNIKTSDGGIPSIPSDNFTKYIKRISKSVCGYDLGINRYRKLFASTKTAETEKKLKNGEITIKEAISELQEASSSSNHSLDVHMKYYVHPVKESEETVEEIVEEPKGKEPESIVEEFKPETVSIIIGGVPMTVPTGITFEFDGHTYKF